jgi:carotenoid 1,2-hydratase
VNVALYGARGARWAMTERGRGRVSRGADILHIGPSSLRWDRGTLVIDLDEVGAPLPKRIRGTIRVTPEGLPATVFALDPSAAHLWQPIAPRCRIDVALSRPDLAWHGSGYLDSNRGREPLEDGFKSWTWSRAHLKRDAVVFYDAQRRDDTTGALALRFAPDGGVRTVDPLPPSALPTTRWGIARSTWADPQTRVTIHAGLEGAPFYARALLKASIYGEEVIMMHESLSLDRFRRPWVKLMLPFRMPRRAG